MSRKWCGPVPLAEYIERVRRTGLPESGELEAWLLDVAKGFACSTHPEELPSLEYTRACDEVQIVCAPCRRLS